MTPQSNFMVLAPILPERETELRQLLDSMNRGPGQVDPNNALLPFAEFETLHFARFVILDDKTTEDIRVYGLTPRTYPLYLAFLGDVDGDANAFLGKLIKRAGKGLGKIFSCCQGFAPDTDLLDWMKQHDAPAIAAYVNWRGRTVRQIREEAALYDALENYVERNHATLHGLRPRELHEKLRTFVNAEQSAGRLTLSKEESNTDRMADQKSAAHDRVSIAGFAAIATASRCCAVLHLCASPLGEKRSRGLSHRRSETF